MIFAVYFAPDIVYNLDNYIMCEVAIYYET